MLYTTMERSFLEYWRQCRTLSKWKTCFLSAGGWISQSLAITSMPALCIKFPMSPWNVSGNDIGYYRLRSEMQKWNYCRPQLLWPQTQGEPGKICSFCPRDPGQSTPPPHTHRLHHRKCVPIAALTLALEPHVKPAKRKEDRTAHCHCSTFTVWFWETPGNREESLDSNVPLPPRQLWKAVGGALRLAHNVHSSGGDFVRAQDFTLRYWMSIMYKYRKWWPSVDLCGAGNTVPSVCVTFTGYSYLHWFNISGIFARMYAL